MRKYGGSRACGMCGNGGAAGLLQGCVLREVPFARADDRIGPPRGMVVGCRFRAVSRSRPQCRAGVFARRLGFAAAQGFRDDASTAARRRRFGAQSTKCRLLARRSSQGKVLPGSTGYLRRKAAMHPSVCALRRIHLPLQGRLSNSCPPKVSPVKGGGIASVMTEGCGAWPRQYPSRSPQTFPALRHYRTLRCGACAKPQHRPSATLSGGRERPPYNIGHTDSKTENSKAPCAGADTCFGLPTGLAGAAVSASYPVPGRNVGRAFSPAAWGLRQHRASGTMQASSPTDLGKALPKSRSRPSRPHLNPSFLIPNF